jgi:telomerase reverse transcriptase
MFSQVASIPWLYQDAQSEAKMCMSDFTKRKELLAEFVYYIFDSFLIPLIRSNFHITETNVHRNRLFYFRHDVWRTVSEPAMASLRGTMFEEMDTEHARKRLNSRPIGYSHVRLLPKSIGFRPITNLRRRPQFWQNGRRILGRSINSVMAPVFRVLNYEKVSLFLQRSRHY